MLQHPRNHKHDANIPVQKKMFRPLVSVIYGHVRFQQSLKELRPVSQGWQETRCFVTCFSAHERREMVDNKERIVEASEH